MAVSIKVNSISNYSNKCLALSILLHALFIAFLFYFSLSFLQDKVSSEGAAVAIGVIDDSTLGLDPQGEQLLDPTVADQNPIPQPSTPTTSPSQELVTKNSDVPIKSKPTKPEKISKDKNPPVKNNEPKNNTNTNTKANTNITPTNNTTDNAINDQKKKFGTLFGKSAGQGDQSGQSNKGTPDGEPDAKALEGISKGRGEIGGGLSGRKVTNAPTISENSQKTGRVVVKVCVNKTGQVISAKFTQDGSTTSDSQLTRIAEKGAMKYQFAPGSLDNQCGTITFDFKVS